MTRDFFSVTSPQRSRVGMQKLHRADGSLTSTLEDMRELATQFHSELLTEKSPSPSMTENHCTVLSHVRHTARRMVCIHNFWPHFLKMNCWMCYGHWLRVIAISG